jgi:thiamine-phosphate pyrophosphorylase
LTKLADVCKKVKIPVFAIGGISIERVNSVMKEGAHGVAVISAILKAESVYDAAVNMLDELRCS